jgi:hypothetical protein
MQEPNPRTSRLAIATGLVAAIAIGGGGFFLGRTTSPSAETAPAARPVPAPAPAPAKIAAPRTLQRMDIIALGDRAADALTSGKPATNGIDGSGQRFELVLPFGCHGAVTETSGAPLSWHYDADARTLRIRVFPTQWEPDEWGLGKQDEPELTLEGFWVSRPWSSAERCPEARGEAMTSSGQAITLPGQTLAVSEILSDEGRRGKRPYEVVQRVQPDMIAGIRGFAVRLTGRITRFPNGQTVQCVQPAGIEQRPICMIAVSMDEIRIENPLGGETLGIWSMRQIAGSSSKASERPERAQSR